MPNILKFLIKNCPNSYNGKHCDHRQVAHHRELEDGERVEITYVTSCCYCGRVKDENTIIVFKANIDGLYGN